MSFLPQRKKSTEEINRLRESLGVPGSPATESAESPSLVRNQGIDTLVATHHQAEVIHESPAAPEMAEPLPAPRTFAPHENRSLKHSEHDAAPQESQAVSPRIPRQVKSLRRSEREPLASPSPTSGPAGSKLPIHRHSDDEIGEMRRREMLAMTATPPANPRFAGAHPALIIPGYLLAAVVWLPLADTLYQSMSVGAGLSFFGQPGYPIVLPAVPGVVALLIAGFVFVRKPVSRHHAAFITAITVFALVFEALHYFPQLRHAT